MPNHIDPADTANERLKAGESARIWGSLILATVLHATVFALWPAMEVDVVASAREAAEIIRLPEVEIPPPPEAMPRPLGPIVASPDVSADVVPDIPRWEDVPDLPPPPPDDPVATSGSDPFAVYTVAPSLVNEAETQRVLQREYPDILRDAGIGGTVPLLVHIDEEGRVLEARVERSSGYEGLDRAALRVADAMRFRPALNRDRRVAVWIKMPIRFRVGN